MKKTLMKKTLASIGVAAMLSLGGALAAAPAHADPIDCIPSVSGSPGNSSFTLHIDRNQCNVPLWAWGKCTMDELGLVPWEWTTTSSETTAYSGSVEAGCGAAIIENYYYGYDQYWSGSWHRYNMYFNEWES